MISPASPMELVRNDQAPNQPTTSTRARGGVEGFEESLRRHLAAILDRDLRGLAATVADDVIAVWETGEVVHGKDAFLLRYAEWFRNARWSLLATPIVTRVTPHLATSLVREEVREPREDGLLYRRAVRRVTFCPDGDGWLLVEDQRTIVRRA